MYHVYVFPSKLPNALFGVKLSEWTREKKTIKLKRTSKQLISTLYDNNVDAVRHESVYLSEYVKKSLSIYNLYMHDEENNFYNIVLNK